MNVPEKVLLYCLMYNALLLKHYTTASVNNVVLCLHPHNSLEEKHHQFTPSSVFNPTLPSKKLHPANQEHEQLSPPHPPIHQARETQHQLQMLLNADDCGNPPTIIKTWVPVSNSLFGWFCHLKQESCCFNINHSSWQCEKAFNLLKCLHPLLGFPGDLKITLSS